MTDIIRLRSVSELLSSGDDTKNAAGILEVDVISPGGSYGRVPPCLMDVTLLQPQYKAEIAKTAQTSQQFDPLYNICFLDGCITGQGSVTTRGNDLVLDSCWEFFSQSLDLPGFTRLEQNTFRQHLRVQRVIEEPVFVLKRPWWENYGHWLVDAATWLSMFDVLRLPKRYHIAIGDFKSANLNRIVEETCLLLGNGASIIRHQDNESWRCQQLHYLSPMQRSPLFKFPPALVALRTSILRAAKSPLSYGKRLYIHRKDSLYRGLENEVKIIELCQSYNFTVVQPEKFSLVEQAALFNQAEIVVGIKGAAFTNLIFARASSAVLLLSPADWPDLFFWDIACIAGIRYSEIFGSTTSNLLGPSHNPFTIDVDVFEGVLRSNLRA